MNMLLWIPVICIVVYVLYIRGILVVQSKRAVVYIGSLRGNRARFSSCTGFTRRIIRFRDSRPYCVTFHSELTGGNVVLEILDSAKRTVLCLDGDTGSGTVQAEKGKRYYLVIRFQSATGNYDFCWS